MLTSKLATTASYGALVVKTASLVFPQTSAMDGKTITGVTLGKCKRERPSSTFTILSQGYLAQPAVIVWLWV